MAIVANPTVDDGTDEIELLFEDFNDDPGESALPEISIPNKDGNNTQALGTGRRVIEGTLFISDQVQVNGAAAGDVDTVEDILRKWHNNQTEVTYTEDDGTTTFTAVIAVDFDKPRNLTPNLIRANILIVEV